MTNDMLTHDPSTAASAPAAPPGGTPQAQAGGTTNSVLLEEAYEAYCQLREKGIPFDPSTFIRGYKPIQSSLARLIELHRVVEEEGEKELAEVDWKKASDWLRGRYEIECELGEGKFSRVFLATQPRLGHRRVALKVTWEGDGEAYTLGRIDHPNIISIHAVETLAEQGLSVICMPYEGSATLCRLLDRVLASDATPPNAVVIHEAARDPHASKSTAVPEAAARQSYEEGIRRLFARICDALAALHAKEILHRDLKPSNILFRPDGSPVLLDFNLARDAKAPSNRFGGTFPYMPPEQLRAMAGITDVLSQKLDARSDIYSVGALLWETLTGNKPFGDTPHSQSAAECIREFSARQQAGFTAPMPPNWTVSPELTNIVRRCLSVNPDERPKTAAQLRDLLVPPPKRRRTALIAGFLAASILIAAGGVWAGTRQSPPSRERTDHLQGNQLAAARFYQAALDADWAGNHDAADEAISRAILEDRENSRYYRARAYLAARRPTLSFSQAKYAIADLSRARELGFVETDHAIQAYFEHVAGNTNPAASAYQKAWNANQRSISLANNFASFCTINSRDDDAIAMLNDFIVRHPELQAPRINRGTARMHKSKAVREPQEQAALRDGAITDFKEAIRLGPDVAGLHVNLAMVLASPEPRDGWDVHLARAIELGVDPKKMPGGAAWIFVEQTPEFQALRKLQPGSSRQKIEYLIPPRPMMP